MKLRPLYDMVLIEPMEASEQIGGIYVAPSAQKEINEGTVIAVGPGSTDVNGKFVEPQVKVGDHAVFNRMRTMEITEGSKKYLMMNLSEVLAVRDPE